MYVGVCMYYYNSNCRCVKIKCCIYILVLSFKNKLRISNFLYENVLPLQKHGSDWYYLNYLINNLSFSICRVCFPVQINQLPRESQLTVTLYATPLPPPGGAEEKSKQKRSIEALGWVTMPLFNFRQ